MSYIYKISNNINNKVYIGKTNLNIQERFKQHLRDSKKEYLEHRPLYNAIRKYGSEHFTIECIEECVTDQASTREQYWIQFYDSYKNGYNATKGGDGKAFYDHEKIAQRLKEGYNLRQVAQEFNCSVDLVAIIGREYHIDYLANSFNNLKKRVAQYDKSNQYIQTFNSTVKAAQWLYDNNKVPTLNSGVRSHISDAANGKRKTAYKYIWKYI